MSTPITHVLIQAGSLQACRFLPDAVPGDTITFPPVTFPQPFPRPPQVILTANDLAVAPGEHTASVVGMARQVTPTGFTPVARSSDCASGSAGLNWLAVLETPGHAQPSVDFRFGARQPQHFQPDGMPGDTREAFVTFSTPCPPSPGPAGPVVLLTATNLR